jgi:hypothetical protein
MGEADATSHAMAVLLFSIDLAFYRYPPARFNALSGLDARPSLAAHACCWLSGVTPSPRG